MLSGSPVEHGVDARPQQIGRGPVEFARQLRGEQPLQRAAGDLTQQLGRCRQQSLPVPVPQQFVQPPVDHRVHALLHVLAQHRVAPSRRELSRADPSELAACREQEPLDPHAERLPLRVLGRRQRAFHRRELPVQRRGQQAALVREMAVDRLLAHPELTGEVVHARPRGARREEQPAGRLHDHVGTLPAPPGNSGN